MHTSRLFFAVAYLVAVQAQSLADIFTQLPNCAIGCLIPNLTSSPCGLTNVSCICTDTPLQYQLSVCIQDACDYMDQRKVSVANQELCSAYPVEFRGREILLVTDVLGSIGLLTIGLRIYSRMAIAQRLWWDDWFIIMSGVLLAAIVTLADVNVSKGFGGHIWNIKPDNVELLLTIFWCAEMLYVAVLTTIRISILLFYLRVFRRRIFLVTVRVFIGIIAIGGLAVIFVVVFQCRPVSAVFDYTIHGSQCINVSTLAYTVAGVGIGMDLGILILPISELLTLQMSLKSKLSVLFMFSIGGFACITSIVRLKFLVDFGGSKDPTWDNTTAATWSSIEITVATICACLPSIRALFSRWFPTLFESSTVESTGQSFTSKLSIEITVTTIREYILSTRVLFSRWSPILFKTSTRESTEQSLTSKPSIGIAKAKICACLSSLRALFSRWIPTLFETSTRESKEQLPISKPMPCQTLDTPWLAHRTNHGIRAAASGGVTVENVTKAGSVLQVDGFEVRNISMVRNATPRARS